MNEGRRIKDPLLEKYAAGALTPEVRAQVDATLKESAADRARLKDLEDDNRAFLVAHPPGPLVAKFEEAGARRKSAWWRLPMLVGPLAAAAAVLVVVLLVPKGTGRDSEPAFTTKGEIALTVFKKEGGVGVRLKDGETLHGGDSIRFEVRAPKEGFVAVLSQDAKGEVQAYFPFEGTQAEQYRPDAAVLEGAVELDATPGTEELYALWSEKPFGLDWAVRALKSGSELQSSAPPGVSVGHAEIHKQ